MVVGFCGGIGAGKDTAFARLRSMFSELDAVQVSFARQLKESAAAALGVHPRLIEAEKRNPKATVIFTVWDPETEQAQGSVQSLRQFLQSYGTEAHRNVFGTDFWVDQAMPMDLDHSGKIVCATDVRFPNELQRVVDLGGVNILIDNDLNEATPREAAHSSETSIDMSLVSYTINNRVRDDNYEFLDRQVHAIMDKLLKTV